MDSIPPSRVCHTCRQDKPLTDFYTRSNGQIYHDCIECKNRKRRERYHSDREYRQNVDAQKKAYQHSHLPQLWEKQKVYEKLHPDRLAKHHEQVKQHQREKYRTDEAYRLRENERSKAWHLANKDLAKAIDKRWAQNNHDKTCAKTHRRRVRIENAACYSVHEWRAMKEWFGEICLCCLHRTKLTVDHVIPLAHGGSNTIENIQPLCPKCNRRKYVEHIDYRNPATLQSFLSSLTA